MCETWQTRKVFLSLKLKSSNPNKLLKNFRMNLQAQSLLSPNARPN